MRSYLTDVHMSDRREKLFGLRVHHAREISLVKTDGRVLVYSFQLRRGVK